jgi:5-(carboxyamino)imidazole ribonucleotide synthase
MVNLVGAEGFGNVVYENMEKILGWTGVTHHIFTVKKWLAVSGHGHIVL